jgi:hypothetical protein
VFKNKLQKQKQGSILHMSTGNEDQSLSEGLSLAGCGQSQGEGDQGGWWKSCSIVANPQLSNRQDLPFDEELQDE